MAHHVNADAAAVLAFLKSRAENMADQEFGRAVLAGRTFLSYAPAIIAKRTRLSVDAVMESLNDLHDRGVVELVNLQNAGHTTHNPTLRIRLRERGK